MDFTVYPAFVSARRSSASGISWPSFKATATSFCSRLTTTSAVAGNLRNCLSIPCAQNAQTRPLTFISMVTAWADAPTRKKREIRTLGKSFMGCIPLEIEHDHCLWLAAIRDASLDPDTTFEEPQQQSGLRSAVNSAGVLACLDEKPSREASVVMLVGRESELHRVDAMRELRASLQVRLE